MRSASVHQSPGYVRIERPRLACILVGCRIGARLALHPSAKTLERAPGEGNRLSQRQRRPLSDRFPVGLLFHADARLRTGSPMTHSRSQNRSLGMIKSLWGGGGQRPQDGATHQWMVPVPVPCRWAKFRTVRTTQVDHSQAFALSIIASFFLFLALFPFDIDSS